VEASPDHNHTGCVASNPALWCLLLFLECSLLSGLW